MAQQISQFLTYRALGDDVGNIRVAPPGEIDASSRCDGCVEYVNFSYCNAWNVVSKIGITIKCLCLPRYFNFCVSIIDLDLTNDKQLKHVIKITTGRKCDWRELSLGIQRLYDVEHFLRCFCVRAWRGPD